MAEGSGPKIIEGQFRVVSNEQQQGQARDSSPSVQEKQPQLPKKNLFGFLGFRRPKESKVDSIQRKVGQTMTATDEHLTRLGKRAGIDFKEAEQKRQARIERQLQELKGKVGKA